MAPHAQDVNDTLFSENLAFLAGLPGFTESRDVGQGKPLGFG